MAAAVFDPKPILALDGYLKPELPAIGTRFHRFAQWKQMIKTSEGGYDAFSKGYNKFGFNVSPDNTVVYREWAPSAAEAYLIGDFSACAYFASDLLVAVFQHQLLLQGTSVNISIFVSFFCFFRCVVFAL